MNSSLERLIDRTYERLMDSSFDRLMELLSDDDDDNAVEPSETVIPPMSVKVYPNMSPSAILRNRRQARHEQRLRDEESERLANIEEDARIARLANRRALRASVIEQLRCNYPELTDAARIGVADEEVDFRLPLIRPNYYAPQGGARPAGPHNSRPSNVPRTYYEFDEDPAFLTISHADMDLNGRRLVSSSYSSFSPREREFPTSPPHRSFSAPQVSSPVSPEEFKPAYVIMKKHPKLAGNPHTPIGKKANKKDSEKPKSEKGFEKPKNEKTQSERAQSGRAEIKGDSPETTIMVDGVKATRIIGDWALGAQLGQGASGTVSKALNIKTGMIAAAKVISKDTLQEMTPSDAKGAKVREDELQFHGLYREIAVMKLMNHPNVVRLHSVIHTVPEV